MEKFKTMNWVDYSIEMAIVIVAVTLLLRIILLILTYTIKKVSFMSDKKYETMLSVFGTLAKFLSFVFIIIYAISPFIDVSKILAGAGVLGIVIGFGAQSLIKDILTGFFFLFEKQLMKGDFVTINNKFNGTVEEVGFRALKVRDWGGKLLTISNGNIVEICNGNVEKRRVVEGILVSYDENPDNVFEVLNLVCAELNLILNDSLIKDEEGNIVEDFRVRGIMDLTINRGGLQYTIVGLVKDGDYFDCMYKTREVLVKKIYENKVRMIEDRVHLIQDTN